MATMVAAAELDHSTTMMFTKPVTVTRKHVPGELPEVPTHDPTLALVMPSAPTAAPVLPAAPSAPSAPAAAAATESAAAATTDVASAPAAAEEKPSSLPADVPAVADFSKLANLYPAADAHVATKSAYPTLPAAAPSAPAAPWRSRRASR